MNPYYNRRDPRCPPGIRSNLTQAFGVDTDVSGSRNIGQQNFQQKFNPNSMRPNELGYGGPSNTAFDNNSFNAHSSWVVSGYFENMHLRLELLKKYESLEYQAKLELRQHLPVVRQRSDIICAVRNHQVVLIISAKGYGKSSQVPQIILDASILDNRGSLCRIVCAGQSKLNTMLLAERVACERIEVVGQSVGFQVRRESCLPRQNACILYCTYAKLLKELRNPPATNGPTIFIIDDIEENNSEAHEIMCFLKQMLPLRPDIKIILLSSGAFEHDFTEYFDNYHVLFVQKVETNAVIDLTLDEQENLSADEGVDEPLMPDSPCAENEMQKSAQNTYNRPGRFINSHLNAPSMNVKSNGYFTRFKRNETGGGHIYQQQPNILPDNGISSQEIDLSHNGDCIPTSSSMASGNLKRTISMEGSEWRRKVAPPKDKRLEVAVIDETDPNGKISPEKWLAVESKLLFDMASEKWSTEDIAFDSVHWSQGIKVITCRNERSIEFLKTALAEAKQYMRNCNLKVVARSTIPLCYYATVWVRPPVPTLDQILQLIKKQNEGLNTDRWNITATQPGRNVFGKQFRLVIDEESAKRLRANRCRVKFGLGSLQVRLQGCFRQMATT